MDHLFGLQAVLELKPDITIYIPSTFHAEAERFIAGGVFPEAHAANAVPHTGEIVRLEPGGVHALMPGLAAVGFDLPIMLGVEGEQSLYANLEREGSSPSPAAAIIRSSASSPSPPSVWRAATSCTASTAACTWRRSAR